MRKYDTKNKRNITLVLVICIVILIGFALFIKRVNDIGKKFYTLDVNSVLYDSDKNRWTLENTGTLKIKWSGNYYMQYNDEEIALNKQVVVYNNATKIINLYGTIYKINKDASVDTLEDESIVEDTIVPKFYKLADRKYLLIASDIANENDTFTANDYLIVELDKLGNATLTNNKVNMKTLTETILKTSAYSFDIANEILYFGEEKIELKKIIGSTNEYVPEEESSSIESNSGSNNSNASSEGQGQGNSNENENNGNTGENNENAGDNNSVTDDNVYQDKNLSVVKNTIGTNYLSIDYSIYDPKNEYKNVFLEIENDSTKAVETYYLAKNGNTLKISKLTPNTKYNLVYKYSYTDESGNVLSESFANNYSITTTLPETYIEISKMTSKEVFYKISEDDSLMYKAVVDLYINDAKVASHTFNSDNPSASYFGSFDIRDYTFDYLTLKVTSITYSSGTISTDVILRVKN